MIDSILRDLLFGIRMLFKNPGFTAVSVLSLAVGIGVNSTVFGFVNAVFFKTIAVSNSEGLVHVFAGDGGNPYRNCSYPNYLEFRRQNEVFSGLAAYSAPPMLLTRGNHTEEINSEVVSGNYFSVLDVRMQRGPGFSEAHDQLSFTEPSVIISDGFWKRRLNSEADILSKQLIINGISFSVVGIAPPNFTGIDPTNSTDIWVPITQWAGMIERAAATTNTLARSNSDDQAKALAAQTGPANSLRQNQGRLNSEEGWLGMIGRLKPGVSREQAEAVMGTIAARLPRRDDKAREWKITLSPVSSIHPAVAEEIPAALSILALASLILLICCINVASLMLARAAARRKEFAIRMALGSSRQRFVRQLLAEALLLALPGGVLGLLFAAWTTKIVLGFIPPGDLGFSSGISIDLRVLVFSFAISLLTSLVFGLLPALNTLRPGLVQALGSEGMAIGGARRRINLRRVLVVVQIIASFVLLIAAGLFLRSFQQGQAITETFRSDRILLLDLSPKKYGYAVNYSKAFYHQLLNTIGATPGVDSVTLSSTLPFTMHSTNSFVGIEGRQPTSSHVSVVADGFFKTLNIPILRGRDFERTDTDSSRKVVIVNETMARAYWPNENPLGKLLQMDRTPYEIVGVVKDSPYNSLGRSAEPYLYVWLYQQPPGEQVSLIVRTSAEPRSMTTAIQRSIKELGANLPIFDFQTLDDVSHNQLVLVKAASLLMGLLGLIGLAVASAGIFGVTSFAFSQRRREIGIRIALGAERSDILKLILREGIGLAVVGLVIGVLLAVATTHLASSILYGVSPLDPIVFIGVVALLGLVALGASLAPAIKAANSDPVEALRHQ
jgi:putative ABC transport system permease protein